MSLMQVEEIERLPREGLESIQLQRLQRLVARVYEKVKPYREKMDQAGVKPADIQSACSLCPWMTSSGCMHPPAQLANQP